MAKTYTPIATQKLTAFTTTLTFSSIPQTYTDLILVCNAVENLNNHLVWAQVNGDTGAHYSDTVMYGTGSAVPSTYHANASYIYAFLTSDTANKNATMHFMNYANTTSYKNILVRSNSTANYVQASVHVWRGSTGSSTEAISSITLSASSNWAPGSTFTLYGILKA